jgi:hypothetical protein
LPEPAHVSSHYEQHSVGDDRGDHDRGRLPPKYAGRSRHRRNSRPKKGERCQARAEVVTKLVPLDNRGQRTDVPWIELKNTDLADARLVPRTTTACKNKCRKLNSECVVSADRRDTRPHWVIV